MRNFLWFVATVYAMQFYTTGLTDSQGDAAALIVCAALALEVVHYFKEESK